MNWLLLVAAVLPQTSLDLVCVGSGSASRVDPRSTYLSDGDGGYVSGSTVGRRSEGYGDTARVTINGATGRIRLPQALLPSIRGGKDGWFEIRNLKVLDDEITGKAAISIIHRPAIRLDRLTGTISVAGRVGTFAGVCKPVSGNMERQF